MLSHEPQSLAPICNAVTVLRRAHPTSDEVKRARTVVERQVGHLSRLVDDLLDVSRIAQGKVRLQKEPVDLTEVVRRIVDDHQSLFATKGVSVDFEVGDALWAEADATRLAQTTENLHHNGEVHEPGWPRRGGARGGERPRAASTSATTEWASRTDSSAWIWCWRSLIQPDAVLCDVALRGSTGSRSRGACERRGQPRCRRHDRVRFAG
jgi:hypothetical protein